MSRNIVFVSAGAFAFGECVLALNFARGLSPFLYRPCFIVSPINQPLFGNRDRFEVLTLYPEAPSVNSVLVKDFLERNPPDLFVLCDFLTFEHASAEHGMSIDYLRTFEKPIVSLDSYEWESTAFVLDFLAGIRRSVSPILLDLDGGLRPCPINKPSTLEARSACYSFFRQLGMPDFASQPKTREELGIPNGRLLIVSAIAPWEALSTRQIPPGPFRDLVPQLIQRYVSLLDVPVFWVRIGATREPAFVEQGRVTVHDCPSLPASEFDALVFAADLLVTTNVASTTLAKRVGHGQPALCLHNSVSADGPQDLCHTNVRIQESTLELLADAFPVRPFRMFPLGWYDFLGPVMRGNPYLDTFYPVEILDEEQAVAAMRRAVSEGEGEAKTKRAAYRELLASLPLPDDCVDHFVR